VASAVNAANVANAANAAIVESVSIAASAVPPFRSTNWQAARALP
jgi:hypothetical protein